jgi:hypothetical protein
MVIADTFVSLRGFWFVVIGVLWAGYLVLEGFDFGVGMLMRLVGHSDAERKAVIGTAPPSPPSRTGTRPCSPATTSSSS